MFNCVTGMSHRVSLLSLVKLRSRLTNAFCLLLYLSYLVMVEVIGQVLCYLSYQILVGQSFRLQLMQTLELIDLSNLS